MRILVIEDDKDLCGLMQQNLQRAGHLVDMSGDGLDGLFYLKKGIYDVVLLDRMLPGLDGLSVLRQARGAGVATPIVLITALGNLADVVEGLDAGADDYIVKPFAVDELLARVRAVGRRPVDIAPQDSLVVADVTLHPREKILQSACGRCTLSKRECALLEVLMRNPGKTLPRKTLFHYVWGIDTPVEEASLDSYIRFVRTRLEEVKAPLEVVTLRGVGYRLEQRNV